MEATFILGLTITALFFLTSTILLLALSHIRLMQKLDKMNNEGMDSPDEQKKLNKVLNDAYERSLKIITSAEVEAQDIIHQGKIVAKEEQTAVTKALKEATDAHVSAFESLLTAWQKETQQALKLSSDQMSAGAKKQLESFQKSLVDGMKSSQGQFEQQFEQYLTKAQQEIEAFKQAQLTQVSDQAKKLVMTVAQKALQTKLSPKEHEELIINALEHAKSQGLLWYSREGNH